jgi:hypothetical protein
MESICQSCGMPLSDAKMVALNADKSKSEYCVYCFKDGQFTDKGLTLAKQTEKLVMLSVKQMGMDEKAARAWASGVLPKLKRWKK